ncbi:MAG TPA: hypothetical protein VJ827_07730 [Rubrobacter sp.]|nr:hypothetical protein [Rubrobacter sp.]
MPDAGVLTNAGGEFSLAGGKPHNNTQYRARFIQGAQDYISNAVPVDVKVLLTLSVRPGQADGKITLIMQGNHKRIVKNVTLNDSKFSHRFSPRKVGQYNVRANFMPNGSNLCNKSVTRAFRVR